MLLADIFEAIRKVCSKEYKLDTAHYVSSPQLSWDAMLSFTGIELELIGDPEMFKMLDNGMLIGHLFFYIFFIFIIKLSLIKFKFICYTVHQNILFPFVLKVFVEESASFHSGMRAQTTRCSTTRMNMIQRSESTIPQNQQHTSSTSTPTTSTAGR